MHSCALLQPRTVAISPPLASSSVIGNVVLLWEHAHGRFIWHRCMLWKALICTHTHILTTGGTRMVQPAKTRSNVSHLMSTPLKSHNTLQTSTHTLTHVSELLRSMQARLNVSPGFSCFYCLVNLIWVWFLTLCIEYDKNVFNFKLIYFPAFAPFVLGICQAFPQCAIPVFQ